MISFLRNQRPLLKALLRFSTQKQLREQRLADIIQSNMETKNVKVEDISQGTSCGLMYNIHVESEKFRGKSLVQQHQMVTTSIKDQLKTIHGFNLVTKTPKQPTKTAPPNSSGPGGAGEVQPVRDGASQAGHQTAIRADQHSVGGRQIGGHGGGFGGGHAGSGGD